MKALKEHAFEKKKTERGMESRSVFFSGQLYTVTNVTTGINFFRELSG